MKFRLVSLVSDLHVLFVASIGGAIGGLSLGDIGGPPLRGSPDGGP